jgi:hypothetical protein
MTIKEIKNELMSGLRVKFTVKGHGNTKFKMVCLEEGINKAVSNNIFQMNVSKFGPTCLTLYAFDMMNNKTVGKIKYADVTLISRVVEGSIDKMDIVVNY